MTKKDFSKNFSLRLAKLLDGRTHTAIGERIGYSRAVLSKYLAGDIPESFLLLNKLAQEYEIDIHWLITGKLSPEISKAVNILKPFVYAHLGKIAEEVEVLNKEREELLKQGAFNLPTLKVFEEGTAGGKEAITQIPVIDKKTLEKFQASKRLEEVNQEIEDKQMYYKAIMDALNKVLEPLGEKI